MDTNYRFAGKTLDVGAEGLEKLMQDQFIDTADEETISRWEKWLNLLPDSQTDLIQQRRKGDVWNGGDKFSGSLIKSIVKNYTGCDETPSVRMTTRLTISVQIKEENQVYISDLEALIEKMKPAHILAEVLLISTTKIKFHTNITHYVFPYELCGTKPDIATVGAYIPSGMNVGTISNDVVYPHMPSDENMLAGTYPTDTTKGMVLENGVNIRTSSSDMVYGHLPSSEEQEAGTYPENTTVGISYEDKITISTNESSALIAYEHCGTNPDIATLGQQSENRVSFGTSESSCCFNICRMRYKSMWRGGIVVAWQKTFLDKNRRWWAAQDCPSIKYYASATGKWYEGRFTEKSMSGNTMTFKIETTDEMSITITKVRLLDADGDVAYEGNRSIVKSSTEGALIQIDVPMVEE